MVEFERMVPIRYPEQGQIRGNAKSTFTAEALETQRNLK